MADNGTVRIILTRPRAASERFAAALTAAGLDADIRICPLMEIVPRGSGPDLGKAKTLLLTSQAAVDVLRDAGPLPPLAAWCVGPGTAAAAREIGLRAYSADGDADALVAKVIAIRPEQPLLHLHGGHVRGDVVGRLRAAGLEAKAQIIYDQTIVPPDGAVLEAFTGSPRIIVPVFSPRSAKLLAAACPNNAVANVHAVAMSQAVADALPESIQTRTRIAEAPNAPAMIRAILAAISSEAGA